MKVAQIEVTQTSGGERVIGISCREGHPMMELCEVVNGVIPEAKHREHLVTEWARHRREMHGGA